MRSLFWRIFATFWLALLLVAGLSVLLGRALNQDALILARHPGLKDLPEHWLAVYQNQGTQAAQKFLERHKRRFDIDTQVLDDEGQPLLRGTQPPRVERFEAHHPDNRLPWRRLTDEYQSPQGQRYLFIYRIPRPVLLDWQRSNWLLPGVALAIALLVLSLLSWWLTRSITQPLARLRTAVEALGQTAYQQQSLAKLAGRRDELGVLAADFNRMGQRLQSLIGSQRQLLRDVSHELRSPLARLRIALALLERAEGAERDELWQRLHDECNQLDALIGEILALARLEADSGPSQPIALQPLLQHLIADAQLLAPQQIIELHCPEALVLEGWPQPLARALDNLLSNALRFSPSDQPIELRAWQEASQLLIQVRDHGPGVAPEHLAQLAQPFFRAPNQSSSGYGLGLAIARRTAERLGGSLLLENAQGGGFSATLNLPITLTARS